MKPANRTPESPALPAIAVAYIDGVVRRVRYRRRVRREVRQELTDHFTDALADSPTEVERQRRARELIEDFGDAKLLAALIRRGKKRNRPVWEAALVRAGQAVLILIGLFVLHTLYMFSGSPSIDTNYVALANERKQPNIAPGDNAWPDYRKAIDLYVQPAPPEPEGEELLTTSLPQPWLDMDRSLAGLSPRERAWLNDYLAANRPAWEAFVAGSRRPYNWHPYEAGTVGVPDEQMQDLWQGSMIAVTLPSLGQLRSVAKAGTWMARIDLEQGRPGKAAEKALAIARAGAHWQNPDAFVIEQLVGAATSSLGHDQIRRILAQAELPPEVLRQMQQEMANLYPAGYPLLGIESERLGFLDVVQRVFTDGGPGGGHVILRHALHAMDFVAAVGNPRASWTDTALLAGAARAGAATFHAGRDETVEVANELYDAVAEGAKVTPYKTRIHNLDPDAGILRLPEWRFWVIRMHMPSLTRAGELVYRSKVEHEATLAIVALMRYRRAFGEYPPALQALVPQYLAAVPMDPYGDGPLRYARRDGGFVLYSVGTDFQDDGGRFDPRNFFGGDHSIHSRVKADFVLWPVPPLKDAPPDSQPGPPPAALGAP